MLIALSLGTPVAIYFMLVKTRSVSKATVMLFGFALMAIAGVDIYLLRAVAMLARSTASLVDDIAFNSELTIALYLFPALFGGLGVNLVSHVLIRHLAQAEAKFEHEHPQHG